MTHGKHPRRLELPGLVGRVWRPVAARLQEAVRETGLERGALVAGGPALRCARWNHVYAGMLTVRTAPGLDTDLMLRHLRRPPWPGEPEIEIEVDARENDDREPALTVRLTEETGYPRGADEPRVRILRTPASPACGEEVADLDGREQYCEGGVQLLTNGPLRRDAAGAIGALTAEGAVSLVRAAEEDQRMLSGAVNNAGAKAVGEACRRWRADEMLLAEELHGYAVFGLPDVLRMGHPAEVVSATVSRVLYRTGVVRVSGRRVLVETETEDGYLVERVIPRDGLAEGLLCAGLGGIFGTAPREGATVWEVAAEAEHCVRNGLEGTIARITDGKPDTRHVRRTRDRLSGGADPAGAGD